MGKKSKEKSDGSSDIFKSLFGDFPEEVGISVFSNNPFQRKPVDHPQQQQLGLGFGSDETRDNTNKCFSENDDDSQRNEIEIDSQLKKRKKDKERKSEIMIDSIDISENVSDTKKKKKKRKESTYSLDVNVEEEKDEIDKKENFDVVRMEINGEEGSNSKMKMKEKKKKRKRDEIEEEYEARNYGVVSKVDSEEGDVRRKVVGEKRKTVHDPAEMLISKEGFDDESKLLRTVFVGNLPLKVKKKALLKEFSSFGEIDSVRIRSVPLLDSKVPRKGAIFKGKLNDAIDSVHAYIVFKDEKSVQASLAHNMAVVGGNHIRVDKACPPRKKLKGENAPLYDRKRTVFLGNLPFDVKDEELYQLFCGINQLESSVEAVRVIRDPNTSLGKGIAYVLFKTRAAANIAVKKNLNLRDRDLRLYHARPESTPSKKRETPSRADNFPAKRFAGASSGTHFDQNMNKGKANLSYQGLRATKSGDPKKAGFRPRTSEQGKLQSRTEKKVERKERKTKRPSVAARKENALRGKTPKQGGKKRKFENRTPESSSHQKKKKVRTFR